MRTPHFGLVLALVGMGCGGDGGTTRDGSIPLADADPNAPDADPHAPDATASTPDAGPNCNPVQGTPVLDVEKIGSGFASPVDLKSPPGDSRIFVVSQLGDIRIIKGDNNVLPTPFLDVGDLIEAGGERGLLGLAFHPNYAQNGRFFIYYTRAGDGAIVLAEGTVSSNPDVANTTTTPLFSVIHNRTNHNGGWIDFGPDKRMYMSLGDGGGGGDPDENGQKTTVLLAKILRLDMDTPGMAKPAPNNPFISDANADKQKIWAFGVRNPWRNSFDRQTGDLYIADVGQDFSEEVDVQRKNSAGGLNYGWNVMEGVTCFNKADVHNPLDNCDKAGKELPIYHYEHNGSGASVTGGYVYRGCKMPALEGTYFFADEAFKAFYSLKWSGSAVQKADVTEYAQFARYRVTTFGQDINGEIIFADYGTSSGDVYRVIPKP